MSTDSEAQSRLLNFVACELARLQWGALAVERLLEERGLVTRAELREAARRVEQDFAEFTALEGMADPEIRLLVTALKARGWRPPASEGGTP